MEHVKAVNAINKLRMKPILTEEEEFIYIESLMYMIEETKDTDYMVELGGYYYEKKIFDKALKYYEMADTYGDTWAAEGLGYIWYYGRTGETDYEKAFHYYSKAADRGYLKSCIKLADMYKNGYYVKKDYGMYCHIIEEAYKTVKDAENLNEPYPEICTRLAGIRKKQNRYEEAISLYHDAKMFLQQRICYTHFFGDLNIMKWLIEDLYSMIPFDPLGFDFYDLYYLLKKPVTVRFRYKGDVYTVEAVETEEGIAIHFDNQWYRNVDDFMYKAYIKGDKLHGLYRQMYGFEAVR
ncbi:MAG: sel1 repeat family protein [Solobacterium sp.]|nr:sel1 repeat family protein [Solobacterium sp.]